MDSIFATTPIPISFSVDNTASSPKYSQLWEVVLVAASPVVLVFCLCFCIVCLVFRKHEPVPETTVVQHSSSTSQATSRRNALANLLRNLPPPPKYDIAVTTSSLTPSYEDVEKNVIFDPVAAIQSARRAASQRNGEACSLSIQYLYPPKYEKQSQPAAVHARPTPASPPAYSLDTVNEEDEDLPSYSDATISTISTPLSTSPVPVVA